MKSYKDKQLLFSLLFLGLAAGIGGHLFQSFNGGSIQLSGNTNLNSAAALLATQENLASKETLPPPAITLGFVGDIMMDRGVRDQVNKNLGGDLSKLFVNTAFLKEPDIMFANLEGPVSDVGTDHHNLYSFRMDPSTIPLLKDAGIDVVSFANNHVNDWGNLALTDTIMRLRSGGIVVCGAGLNKTEAETPAVMSKDGQTVGFLCFSDVGPKVAAATDTTSGILLASDPDFDSIIKNASQKVDALIVSFHWGIEYETTHNARQAELARRAVLDGAVMVEGEHPHVAQDIDTFGNVPILYSLGNFIFDQNFSKDTSHGLFVTATLSGKMISDVTPHTVVFDKNFAPSLEK